MKNILATNNQKTFHNTLSYSAKLIFMQSIYFVSGLLISRGNVLGNYFPFGMSMIAAVPTKNMLSSIAGVIIGYLFIQKAGTSIRYISTIVAIAAVRWTLNDLDKIKKHPLYQPIVAFVPTFITGLALSSVDNFDSTSIMMNFTEALLSAATAYFMYKSYRSTLSRSYNISYQDFACISITLCVVILSLSSISLGTMSLGRILAIIIILLGATCAGVSGGSITGIASGVIFSLPSFGLSYISGSYAFGGMIAGLFAPFGKAGVCVAFMFANALVSFQAGDVTRIVSGFYEIIISTIVFSLIPKHIISQIQRIIPTPINGQPSNSLYKSVIQRLNFASKAISAIPETVEEVSSKLSEINCPDIKDICTDTVYSICNKCNRKVLCWEKDYDISKQTFDNITKTLANGDKVGSSNFSDTFIKRCNRTEELLESINTKYAEFEHQLNAGKRMDELRGIVAEQFSGIGNLLSDIAKDYNEKETFDDEKAMEIENRFKLLGINTKNIVCRIDKSKRMCIDMEVEKGTEKSISPRIICKQLSNICDRKFDSPSFTNVGETCRMQVNEQAVFYCDIGIAQHVCNNGKFCGDNYVYFNDGNGHLIVIISDGMGTGGRAAVDGAMASNIMSNLVKAGISFNCAIKIVNSALIVKSEDESLATLDIISINLFTGEAKFLKAGAPATVVKHQDEILCIDSPSLPIGILSNTSFMCDTIMLNENDCILMVTDGATVSGETWMETELKKRSGNDAEGISKHILNEAIKKCGESHDDDITAIAIKILRKNA